MFPIQSAYGDYVCCNCKGIGANSIEMIYSIHSSHTSGNALTIIIIASHTHWPQIDASELTHKRCISE